MEFFTNTVTYCHKYPSVPFLIVSGAIYVVYYFLYVAKHPRLACKDKRFREFLEKYCPLVTEKFRPTIWCFESRAQTILRGLIKSSPKLTYDSELILLPDGGQILLDWYENESNIFPDTKTRPTVLILPGLTGTSNESYVLHLVCEAAQHGYRSAVFHNRGLGGMKLLTPRTYSAANVDDIGYIVNLMKSRYPQAPVMGTGVSLGGMILFNYIAKAGEQCPLEAAMCISVAWDCLESVEELEKPGLNKHVLNRTLAKGLVENLKQNIGVFDQQVDNLEHILQSSTIKEFDQRFTSRVFGYPTCDDYYKDASLHNKVHALRIPVLVLSAMDDPFSPSHSIPVQEAEENDNIAIVITARGGHIGFLEGLFPRHQNYMDRLFSQFVKAVFTHGPKHLKQD